MNKLGYGKSAQVVNTLAIIMGGKNTFGEVEDVKEITFKQEVIDNRGTGIWSPSDDFETTLKNLNATFAQSINRGEPFIAKGSINQNGKNVPYSITVSLELHEVGTGLKEGEEVKRSLKGRINTYEEVIDGQTTITYNRDAMWLDFGDGVNVMENIASQTL